MQLTRILLAGSVLLQGSVLRGADSNYRPKVVVQAGDRVRLGSIVTFKLPPQYDQLKALKDPWGNMIPVQIDADGYATFIEEYCAKGSVKTYDMYNDLPGVQGQKQVSAVAAERKRIRLMAERLSPIYYQTMPGTPPDQAMDESYLRGGYLHPIHSPSGLILTDDYPTNHLHHHGIWFAWTKTKFRDLEPDFWNMGQRKGWVDFDRVESTWDGTVHGGLKAWHHYRQRLNSDQTIILKELWDVRLYRRPNRTPSFTTFDISSRQECATPDPLMLPQYHYGGLGFRGHGSWDGATNAFFLTSEGETDRVKGNETRGRWCHIGGKVDGKLTGIVLMCHPSNYRFPQPMRLHPTEPFFCFAPQQLGDMQITADAPYVSRYRCVAMDGPPNRELIEQLYADYIDPPKVETRER